MRVLVTGGLGCIGSQIALNLVKNDEHEVVVVDAAEKPRNEWVWRSMLDGYGVSGDDVYRQRIERWRPDEAGGYSLSDIVQSCDAVVHAAASTGIPHSAQHPGDDWASNAEATRVLLEVLREHPRPTVVLSSVKPYRTTFPDGFTIGQAAQMRAHGGLREDDPLDPDEPYAASKMAQSALAQAYARSYDLPVVTLRCSNLYGPAPCHGPRHGWLTWFCISAAIGRPIEVQGGGEQARDMLYGSDVASACRAALAQARTLAGKIFLIGGGASNVVSVRQAAERLAQASGVPIVEGLGRRHEDQLVFVDHGAFTVATGWKPETVVYDGITRTLAWARENCSELRRVYAEYMTEEKR